MTLYIITGYFIVKMFIHCSLTLLHSVPGNHVTWAGCHRNQSYRWTDRQTERESRERERETVREGEEVEVECMQRHR